MNFFPGELPFVILISSNLQTLPLSGGPQSNIILQFHRVDGAVFTSYQKEAAETRGGRLMGN